MNRAKVLPFRKKQERGRILYVAYPLLPVEPESAGGAEQALATVERHAADAGWQTTIAACNGSVAAGHVYTTGLPGRGRLQSAFAHESRHCQKVLELISVRAAIGTGFDGVHDHSGSFFAQAHKLNVPVLATLHLPRSFYPEQAFHRVPENLFFNCVSRAQNKSFADVPNLAGVVPNGIPLDRFPFREIKKDYLLWLGRICEEKGTHIALDAAKRAGLPIVVAGEVYPFAYHHDYFESQVRPRLQQMGEQAVFAERPSFRDKVALLQNARAVLITSTADETSSLVAMEAAACGTPDVALPRGAISEVEAPNTTGIMVDEIADLPIAMAATARIKSRTCREYAQQHFSAAQMYAEYERLYERLFAGKAQSASEVVAA
jgi:glycosyltransferase involved in cell wall biosynthesis